MVFLNFLLQALPTNPQGNQILKETFLSWKSDKIVYRVFVACSVLVLRKVREQFALNCFVI